MATMRRAANGADANGEREEAINQLEALGGKLLMLVEMRKRYGACEGTTDKALSEALTETVNTFHKCFSTMFKGTRTNRTHRATKPTGEMSVLEQAEAIVKQTRRDIPPEFWELARQIDELYQIAIAKGGEGADA